MTSWSPTSNARMSSASLSAAASAAATASSRARVETVTGPSFSRLGSGAVTARSPCRGSRSRRRPSGHGPMGTTESAGRPSDVGHPSALVPGSASVPSRHQHDALGWCANADALPPLMNRKPVVDQLAPSLLDQAGGADAVLDQHAQRPRPRRPSAARPGNIDAHARRPPRRRRDRRTARPAGVDLVDRQHVGDELALLRPPRAARASRAASAAESRVGAASRRRAWRGTRRCRPGRRAAASSTAVSTSSNRASRASSGSPSAR